MNKTLYNRYTNINISQDLVDGLLSGAQ